MILRERNINIWKQKLDWIAERGGMVLLNTHPDYMCFNGDQQRDEFPVSYYEEFLSYVRDKYQGQLWSALPREVARYYSAAVPALVAEYTQENLYGCVLSLRDGRSRYADMPKHLRNAVTQWTS